MENNKLSVNEKHHVALSFLGVVAIIASVGLLLVGNGMLNPSDSNELTGQQVRYAAARAPAPTPYKVLYGRGGSSYVYTPPVKITPTQKYTPTPTPVKQSLRGESNGACCVSKFKTCSVTTNSRCNYFSFYPGKSCYQSCPSYRR